MSGLDRLLALQDLDLALDQLRHRLAHLAERSAVAAAQHTEAAVAASAEAAAEAERSAAREQQRHEDEVATLSAKIDKVSGNLYGGGVTDAGDLQALQHELDSLTARRRSMEDDLLEVMEAAEEAAAAAASAAETLEEARRTAEGARVALSVAEAGVAAAIDEAEVSRRAALEGVPPALVETYERLRARGLSPAVARFVGGACGGCHLSLPATEVDRIKKTPPEAEVFCEQCGCLLVRGGAGDA